MGIGEEMAGPMPRSFHLDLEPSGKFMASACVTFQLREPEQQEGWSWMTIFALINSYPCASIEEWGHTGGTL